MKMNWKHAVALVVALLLAQSASAQGRGSGKPDGARERGDRGRSTAPARVIVDHDGHRRIAADYFRKQSLPPGLAKRQSLPPGLAKQLRENGELPPGLEKHFIEVPAPLHARLPPLPASHRRYFVGNDLMVVEGNHIVAIIPNVLH